MKGIQLNFSNGQLIGTLTGQITKFLSYEAKIADLCELINSNEPLAYCITHDKESDKTILNIKGNDGKLYSQPTKYAIGETIEIDGTVDAFFRRYRTARNSPALRLAFMKEIKKLLALDDAENRYYMRITDIKLVGASRINAHDACDLGVCSLTICKRKSYYIPDFDTDSITFYSTAHRAMMALAYKTLPQNVVLNNRMCLMYEFEIFVK